MAPDTELRELVADADVLMNLLASGCVEEVLSDLRMVLLVTPTVAKEAMYLEAAGAGTDRERIDLTPLVAKGLVRQLSIDDGELDLLVELARSVDDGEAEVIAVAYVRRLAMATDDRKARRTAAGYAIEPMSTPELLRQWQVASDVDDPRMGAVLTSVRRRSRYQPPSNHVLASWWQACCASAVAATGEP